jgi:hypothetical protein
MYLLREHWSTPIPGSDVSTPQINDFGLVAHLESEEQIAILRCFKAQFGAPVGKSWIIPYVGHVHNAQLDQLNSIHQAATLGEKERAEWSKTESPHEVLTLGDRVLEETRRTMTAWPLQPALPTWLDGPMTAYWIGRYGFESGGGAKRTISRKRLIGLLTDPKALAKELGRPQLAKRFRSALEHLAEEARLWDEKTRLAKAQKSSPGRRRRA